jgi:YVTN family beta-propeller protein
MKRLILFFAFTTFGFSQNYYLYVAAESDDTVSLIKFDGKNATELERIPVGIKFAETEGPHGLTVDPSGDYWYLSLAHGNPYGTLTKFSTKTNTEIATTELGYFPATMEISSLTGLLYCVNFKLYGTMTPSSVSVVDPQTMTEITKIPTGVMPHGSRISPDGRFQYSVAMMSGELYEVDTVSLEVNRILQLDNNHHMDHQGMDHQGMHHSTTQPTWVIPHPSDSKVYIAGNFSNEIIEVDTDSWEIINRFKTGKGPYNIDITSDGKKTCNNIER